VGVLATPTTFAGELYASVVERFARGVEIYKDTCPGLVEQIEAGNLQAPETRAILVEALAPMLAAGIDSIVMGCTHFPFVIPLIEEITGPGVRVIDPAPAVARQVRRLLSQAGLRNLRSDGGKAQFYTSGDPEPFAELLPRLLDEKGPVQPILWTEDLQLWLQSN
jgi:glutamate racemase